MRVQLHPDVRARIENDRIHPLPAEGSLHEHVSEEVDAGLLLK